MERIIVSRHNAAIAFIARHIHPHWHEPGYENGWIVWRLMVEAADPEYGSVLDSIQVIESANANDVRGKIVYGNLPMHLAANAAEVRVIEFAGTPPRGTDYTLEQMDAAQARIAHYTVRAVEA